jgi:hypothetical protein
MLISSKRSMLLTRYSLTQRRERFTISMVSRDSRDKEECKVDSRIFSVNSLEVVPELRLENKRGNSSQL